MRKVSEKERVLGPVWGGRAVYCCRVPLPNGKEIEDYFLFDLSDWSMVMPVTVEGRTVIIREYRAGVDGCVWSFPVGTRSKKEDPMRLMKDELREETGYQAERVVFLGALPMHSSNGLNCGYLFLALNCMEVTEPELEETEEISVRLVPLSELATELIDTMEILDWSTRETFSLGLRHLGEMIRSGEISRSSPIAAMLRKIHQDRLAGL